MKTLNQKLKELQPGGQVTISQSNNIQVSAERSGNGKRLRFVRHFLLEDRTVVFKDVQY